MSLRTRLALTILLTAIPLAAGLVWLRAHTRRLAQERSLHDLVVTVMQAGGREMCEAFPDMFSGGHALFGPGSLRVENVRSVESGEEMEGLEEALQGLEGGEALGKVLERMKGLQGKEGRVTGFLPGPGRPPSSQSSVSFSGLIRPEPPPEHHFALWAYRADLSGASTVAPPIPVRIRVKLDAGDATASEVFERRGTSVLRMGIRMPWADGPCAVMVAERALPPSDDDPMILWGLAILCGGVLLAVFLAAGPMVRRIRRLKADVKRSAASRYESPARIEGRDEIADLARTFNEAAEEVRAHVAAVEEREETLRRFVADTTHDVMTPLTVLQGHLSAIRERTLSGEAVDPAEVRSSLEEAHYMGSLIHNLDAVAKLEAASKDLTNGGIDLAALVVRVVERHRPIARTRGIDVEFTVPEAPVEAAGDVTLLEQAVSNVVHNAVRYNEDGGHVSVLLESDGDRFVLRVLDDGPGVPPESLPMLAERRFRSTEARTRRKDGRGIGLAIAKDVAERHGLTLTFANLDPHGLEARFEGPRLGAG